MHKWADLGQNNGKYLDRVAFVFFLGVYLWCIQDYFSSNIDDLVLHGVISSQIQIQSYTEFKNA